MNLIVTFVVFVCDVALSSVYEKIQRPLYGDEVCSSYDCWDCEKNPCPPFYKEICTKYSLFTTTNNRPICKWREPKHGMVNASLITMEYINLMKYTITNLFYEEYKGVFDGSRIPRKSCTMIGLRRLDNTQELLEDVIAMDVKGDIIETGVWRGGNCIFMASILKAYNQHHNRKVFAADSWIGIPGHLFIKPLKSSQNPYPEFIRKIKLLEYDQFVIPLKGWFNTTLPQAKKDGKFDNGLSLIRLDGDIYESTMEALEILYPILNINGYVIVDDFLGWEGCRNAVYDYRKKFNIHEPISPVYHSRGQEVQGVWWKKLK